MNESNGFMEVRKTHTDIYNTDNIVKIITYANETNRKESETTSHES